MARERQMPFPSISDIVKFESMVIHILCRAKAFVNNVSSHHPLTVSSATGHNWHRVDNDRVFIAIGWLI